MLLTPLLPLHYDDRESWPALLTRGISGSFIGILDSPSNTLSPFRRAYPLRNQQEIREGLAREGVDCDQNVTDTMILLSRFLSDYL